MVTRTDHALARAVYGYLPYWVTQQYLHFDLLTHIGCFDVTLNPDGTITNAYGFPGTWAVTIDRAHRNGVKVEMVATCFGWYNIHHAIRAPASIPNLVALADSAGVDGINMDFEEILGSDRDTMVLFMRRLSAACRAAGLDLTMATMPLDFANAYDFRALADTTDGLFIMGYDFHWRGGPEAGPVSPLFGWEFYGNLQMAIAEYLGEIGNADKLFLGLPYYGYQWPTYAETTHSRTTGTGEAVYYIEARQRASEYGRRWDGESQTPWYAFNNGGWNQGWYDDDTSLMLKHVEVNDHDFLGTGMWALGYDGAARELWAALRESFNRPLDEFTNGDCETWRYDTAAAPSDTSANPAGWYEGRRAQYRRDAVARSGSSSIRQIPDSLGGSWPVRSVVFQDVRVMPGAGYEFSAWAMKNDGHGNRMRLVIQWHDGGRRVIGEAGSTWLERDSAVWVRLSTGLVAAPGNAVSARLNLCIEGRGGFDRWDDMSFGPLTGSREGGGGAPRVDRVGPTVVRGMVRLSGAGPVVVVDVSGRRVAEFHPGANDVRQLVPGVYFVSTPGGAATLRRILVEW